MWKRKLKLEVEATEAVIFYGSDSGSSKREMSGSGSGRGSSKKDIGSGSGSDENLPLSPLSLYPKISNLYSYRWKYRFSRINIMNKIFYWCILYSVTFSKDMWKTHYQAIHDQSAFHCYQFIITSFMGGVFFRTAQSLYQCLSCNLYGRFTFND